MCYQRRWVYGQKRALWALHPGLQCFSNSTVLSWSLSRDLCDVTHETWVKKRIKTRWLPLLLVWPVTSQTLLLSVGIHTTLLTCWLLLSKQQQLQVIIIIIIVIATFLSILSSYLQDFLIVWFHFGRWEPGFQDNSLIMIITDNTVSVFCSITDRTDIF